MRKTAVFFLCLMMFSLLSGCMSEDEKKLTKSDFMLDTIISVTCYGTDEDTLNSAFDICEKYENMLSMTISGSDVWNINHSEGKSVRVERETAELIAMALEYCELSGGAFDISIAPLSSLWDFSSGEAAVPNTDKINEALSKVDYTKIVVSGCDITLPDTMSIDLGAVAKGYIADRMADYFSELNVPAVINLGGNVVTVGQKPGGEKWKVGIRDPKSEDGGQIGLIETQGASFVTSGVYERCFTLDDVLYHHLLSTQTGFPLNNSLASVTVISGSSAQGDALSTTLYLMGFEDARNYVNSHDGIEAVFVLNDGSVVCTGDIELKK